MAVAKEQIRQIISENNISSVADVYTLLKDSFKDILQELMEAELDATLGYEKNHKGDLQTDNKRNGHSTKNLKSQYGEFQIDVPRDRNGEFEPKLIPKYQRDISGIEEKVISLYARGMSTRDIHDQLQDLYGIELSAEMVSKITDKILPQVKEWQARPLNPVYPFVFMDCIHYKVREDGRILSRAAYVVLGVTVEGYKDILSITVGANETSKFWLGMLNDLKNRGVKDVLFFCVDGLPGFKEAIQAVYPQAEIQRCVIHMLRNSFKYVNYNDLKKFSSDFKAVYNAPNETAALSELENIKEKWGKKYPYAISNWENNWEDVSSFFQFSNDIRRIMYTTISLFHDIIFSHFCCHGKFQIRSFRRTAKRRDEFLFIRLIWIRDIGHSLFHCRFDWKDLNVSHIFFTISFSSSISCGVAVPTVFATLASWLMFTPILCIS